MLHDTDLIRTLTAGLVAAFVGGFIAQRLRISPIVGYVLAGVVVGPFTPGYTADTELAQQIAEIGVILLMFGVGLHFSVRDLLAVRSIAIPGAVAQIGAATAVTTVLCVAWGWSFGEGLVLGMSISVASTVVLLRALESRQAVTSREGRVAVGWLIVEDLFTVFVLVLLPSLAEPLGGQVPENLQGGTSDNVFLALIIAIAKLAALLAILFFVAARAVPWLLTQVARTGSRELFTLSVLAGALGIAFGSAIVFDVSLALGAFMAGLIVGQSAVSSQAASDALPFQDAFAVLFFVSVGMLFDPAALIDEPLRLLALVSVIMLVKSAVAFLIVAITAEPLRTGLVVAAGLAQIGEFSFILVTLALDLELISEDANNLVLGAALITIALNPLAFALIAPAERFFERRGLFQPRSVTPVHAVEPMPGRHAIVVGYGDVGRWVTSVLSDRFDVVVVERNLRVAETAPPTVRVTVGNASSMLVLQELALDQCVVMVVTIPDPFATRVIVERARTIRPNLDIIARAINDEEAALLREAGAAETIVQEREVALEMVRHALHRFGVDQRQALAIVQRLRRSRARGVS